MLRYWCDWAIGCIYVLCLLDVVGCASWKSAESAEDRLCLDEKMCRLRLGMGTIEINKIFADDSVLTSEAGFEECFRPSGDYTLVMRELYDSAEEKLIRAAFIPKRGDYVLLLKCDGCWLLHRRSGWDSGAWLLGKGMATTEPN